MVRIGDIFERIPFHDYEVSELPRFDTAGIETESLG
jgi:hypothetical protein